MKKVDVLLAVEKLKKAYSRLTDAISRVHDDLDKDGVLQRFEFTMELLWKTLKIVLEYNKIDASGGPKHCIKQAFRYGFINDDEIILDMLDDRNRSSHVYDEETSDEIFTNIKEVYVKYIGDLIDEIGKRA